METNQKLPAPAIRSYKNFRQFLSDWMTWKKSQRSTFSLRQFAKKAQLFSPTFLSDVIQGKKNCSLKSAASLALAMSLGPDESSYFIALVRQSLATETSEKRDASKEVARTLLKLKEKTIAEESASQILESWASSILATLREMTGFKEDARWLSSVLRGNISVDSCQTLLDAAKQAERVDKDSHVIVRPPKGTVSTAVIGIVQHWLHLFRSSPQRGFDMNTMILALNDEKYAKVKQILDDTVEDIAAAATDDKDNNQVYWCALYLIPATKPI